jgi:hypothetical protein
MISNFVRQLEEQKAGDRLPEVLKEIPRVREDLGYPPLVTPTSQIVGMQAVLNILLGERYKMCPGEVKDYMNALQKDFAAKEDEWNKMFAEYAGKYPELAKLYKEYFAPVPQSIFEDENYWKFEKPLATRQSSGEILNRLAAKLPGLIGGSADLAPSNNSLMKGREYFSENVRTGTNMHFGIREFAMAAVCNGITIHGGLHAYYYSFGIQNFRHRGYGADHTAHKRVHDLQRGYIDENALRAGGDNLLRQVLLQGERQPVMHIHLNADDEVLAHLQDGNAVHE